MGPGSVHSQEARGEQLVDSETGGSEKKVDLVKITEQGPTLQVIHLHGSGRAGGGSGERG